MAPAKTRRPALPPLPGGGGALLRSRWLPYLVLLPAGVTLILVLAFVVFDRGESKPAPRGTAHADFPVEFALAALVEPGPGEIPEGVEPAAGAHAFLWLLRDSAVPRFAPWARYVQNSDLVGFKGWVDADGSFVSLALYPGRDADRAAAAFAALRAASGEEILSITSIIEPDEILREFAPLAPPGIGEEAFAYRLRHGREERGSDRNPDAVPQPGRVRDVAVIWARVDGVILFAARNASAGAGVPEAGREAALEIEALARNLAGRVAAFDPAGVLRPAGGRAGGPERLLRDRLSRGAGGPVSGP